MAELGVNPGAVGYALKMDSSCCYLNQAVIRFYLTGFKLSPWVSINNKYGMWYFEYLVVTKFIEIWVHYILSLNIILITDFLISSFSDGFGLRFFRIMKEFCLRNKSWLELKWWGKRSPFWILMYYSPRQSPEWIFSPLLYKSLQKQGRTFIFLLDFVTLPGIAQGSL